MSPALIIPTEVGKNKSSTDLIQSCRDALALSLLLAFGYAGLVLGMAVTG